MYTTVYGFTQKEGNLSMRIQTFSKKTGVSRRTIHFYIQKGLLRPKTDESNGYYDFSPQDGQRLILLRLLREAGFPLSAIRSLLENPAAAEYHLRMRLGRVRQERERLKQTEQGLLAVLEDLPVCPDFAGLYGRFTARFPGEEVPRPAYDALLVNHFLWRVFWPEEGPTEYQRFLWDKINRLTRADFLQGGLHEDYTQVYGYLCSQEETKIDLLYAGRNQHYNYVASLSPQGVERYAGEMKQNIRALLENPAAVRQWKSDRRVLNLSLMRIYTSEIGRLGEEMCPFFCQYKQKSTRACGITYQWLHTPAGAGLLERLNRMLGDSMDLEHCNHAELESLSMMMKKGWDTPV